MRAFRVALLCLVLAGLGMFARHPHGPRLHRQSGPQHVGPFRGVARIIDGDTLVLEGQRIRLFGIDAPEHAQICQRDGADYACGAEATAALARLAADPIECRPRANDRYSRVVAVCLVRGHDINAAMVNLGWAVAYRGYSTTYVGEEDAARAGRRGLWAGHFDPPRNWRRRQSK